MIVMFREFNFLEAIVEAAIESLEKLFSDCIEVTIAIKDRG